jgi:WD40 repeat protein
MSLSTVSFYVTGGTLQHDASCYVERRADSLLYESLLQAKFCYVLTSRQMGKSSLMVRTAARLRQEGIAVAILDLTAIGQNLNAEQWYNGLLFQLGERLGLEDELEEFCYEHRQLGPLQRWMRALREVVLSRHSGRVVIFVDEIDVVRSLPFSTDEFFAGIREFYNARTENTELERLTFCLLGVAAPSDLIRDTRMTPFNIGERIELNDFTEREALPLAKGLMREPEMAGLLLKRILYWTGGHPYLTQRLCSAVAEELSVIRAEGVDRVCEELFLSNRAKERDDNLLFVRERILHSEADLAGLLELYKKVHRGRRVRDNETSPTVSILRLSGITRVENGCLLVRNRIYERVFNQGWVLENMPDAELQRQRAAFRRGLLGATTVAAIIIAIISTLAVKLVEQRNRAEEQRAHTEREKLDKSRLLYAAQINLAYQAWEGANVARTLELLESEKPGADQEDLRGFEWYYLWRLCHSELFTLKHKDKVYSVAFSPDGKTLATGCWDNTVKLWDASTGREMVALKGHTKGILSVTFSPDGKILATGSSDGTAKLWSVTTGKELASLEGQTDPGFLSEITSVAFSPDGKALATGGYKYQLSASPSPSIGIAKLWDISNKQELTTLSGNMGIIFSVAFSPDSKTLATGSLSLQPGDPPGPGTLKLWEAATGKEFADLKGHMDWIRCVAFSPDGKTLATGSADKTVKLWDLATRQELVTLKGHTNWVLSLAFSKDGKTLATGSDDNTVKLWDVDTRQEKATLKGHNAGINSVAFTPDQKRLATGSFDYTAKLWDVATRYEQGTLRGHTDWVRCVTFSPDGKTLATGSGHEDKTVKLWDMAREQEMATLKGHTDRINSVVFSPDGKTLATGSDDKTARLWDVATRQELATLGHKETVWSVTFSPDGKTLAIGSNDNTVKLWDVSTQQELAILKGHKNRINSLLFSPDGKILATGSDDNTVKLWDPAGKQELATLKGQNDFIRYVAFSPDGKILATGSGTRVPFMPAGGPGVAELWDVALGQKIATLKGHTSGVSCVAFSPDGKTLATGGWDNIVKLWNINTKQEVATLKGHTDRINSIAFSPDGKTLATGSADKTVKLWRAATEEEVLAKSRQ